MTDGAEQTKDDLDRTNPGDPAALVEIRMALE
jgi:hypothetical protein